MLGLTTTLRQNIDHSLSFVHRSQLSLSIHRSISSLWLDDDWRCFDLGLTCHLRHGIDEVALGGGIHVGQVHHHNLLDHLLVVFGLLQLLRQLVVPLQVVLVVQLQALYFGFQFIHSCHQLRAELVQVHWALLLDSWVVLYLLLADHALVF